MKGSRRVRTNGGIRCKLVVVIDEQGVNLGEMPTPQALALAQRAGMDLVEVAGAREVPVCKIADYGKMQYQQQKKERLKKKSTVEHKEIKMTPATGANDYGVKLRKIRELLEKGATVSVTVSLRGRLQQRPEAGTEMVDRLLADLAGVAVVQSRNSSPRSVSATLRPVR